MLEEENCNGTYNKSKLIHGGQLNQQVQRYNIPREEWLDLSTGISPFSYPFDDITTGFWQRLPERSVEFNQAVANYYRAEQFVVSHGSQAAIQLIPELWAKFSNLSLSGDLGKPGNANSKVWLPKVGYKEHQNYWQRANFDCCFYSKLPDDKKIEEHAVVVVINPNNPSAKIYSKQQLLTLAEQLEKKRGLLVVDEAFIESSIEQSITSHAPKFKNVIALRSIGKFFGLAGARVGFIFSSTKWLEIFEAAMGQWPISGPALCITETALSDMDWQKRQYQRLKQQSQKLRDSLEQHFNTNAVGTILFRVVLIDNAPEYFDALCQKGIYVRLLDDQSGLRFGISNDLGLERLQATLLSIA